MVIRLFTVSVLLLLVACEKELHKLTMPKAPYTGNQLRIDGYYYSNPNSDNSMGIAVFYRDGVCVHMFASPTREDIPDFVENDILNNKPFMSRLWKTPTNIGVFQVDSESLEFEIWESVYDITTFTYFCEIVNDTTFVLSEWVDNDHNKSHIVNTTYRFVQFSPKPDSTNRFIK